MNNFMFIKIKTSHVQPMTGFATGSSAHSMG